MGGSGISGGGHLGPCYWGGGSGIGGWSGISGGGHPDWGWVSCINLGNQPCNHVVQSKYQFIMDVSWPQATTVLIFGCCNLHSVRVPCS